MKQHKYNLIPLFCIFLTLASTQILEHPWQESEALIYKGQRLEGSVLMLESGIHIPTQCAWHCLRNSACKSYNIISYKYICEIHSATHLDGGYLVVDNSSVYYQREALTLDKGVLGPCFSNTSKCNNGGLCIPRGETDFYCSCTENWTGRYCEGEVHTSQWSEWSQWTSCSLSCGRGWQERKRECSRIGNLGTISSGSGCHGSSVEYKECTDGSCARWTDWGHWESCSTELTCGRGTRKRWRSCVGLGRCHGTSNETSICESPSCNGPLRFHGGAVYGEGIVEVFNDLTKSWGTACGEGWTTEDSTVVCRQHGFPGSSQESATSFGAIGTPYILSGVKCSGNEGHLIECEHNTWGSQVTCQFPASVRCNVDGFWGTWSSWNECSVTCGEGVRSRNRTCDSPPTLGEGKACYGGETEVVICTTGTCARNYEWGSWNEWDACSATCGNGTQQRNRKCDSSFHDGVACDGPEIETVPCSREVCPVDGTWSLWTEWSACTLTCGEGTSHRNRSCVGRIGSGKHCEGYPSEEMQCGDACPDPGYWTEWSEWSLCTVTCAGGTRKRSRNCTMSSPQSEHCPGNDSEESTCNEFPCIPRMKSCSTLKEAGMTENTMVEIDPLGFGIPFWVRCNMDDLDGIGITEIVHDQMARKTVDSRNAGEYQLEISYNVTLLEIENLIDVSVECRQFLSWECRFAKINSATPTSSLPLTYAMDRYGELINYWAGGDPDHPNMCQCGVAGTCDTIGTFCNCDADDDVLRKDAGYIKQKEVLPISRVIAGGTGQEGHAGNIIVGAMECSGTNEWTWGGK